MTAWDDIDTTVTVWKNKIVYLALLDNSGAALMILDLTLKVLNF